MTPNCFMLRAINDGPYKALMEQNQVIGRKINAVRKFSETSMPEILEAYTFTAEKFQENDGSVTLSLNEIDLVENGENEEEARLNMGAAILDYANEYYAEYEVYFHAPNRKKHIPYILKALIMDSAEKIGDSIVCNDGRVEEQSQESSNKMSQPAESEEVSDGQTH